MRRAGLIKRLSKRRTVRLGQRQQGGERRRLPSEPRSDEEKPSHNHPQASCKMKGSREIRKAQRPLLEIKISGPGVKPGCIALKLLYKICNEAQEAVNRQAQAIESKTTGKPITEAAMRECALELVGLRKGSTILKFSPADKRPSLLPDTELLGVEAVSEVATALRAVNQRRGKWIPPDPRVLEALEELGSIFDEGVDRLQWIAPGSGRRKRMTAEFVKSYLPKIKRRKQEFLQFEVFPVATEHAVQVPGRLISQSFFSPRTIKQLIVEQQVKPIADVSSLSGAIPDEEVDEFVAEIYRDRKGQSR